MIVGFLTAYEFLFVRGMFTWLLAVAASIVTGLANIVLAVKERRYPDAGLYLLSSIALCMGYYVIGSF